MPHADRRAGDAVSDSAHVRPYIQQTLTTKALHFSISELQSRMDVRRPDALDLEYTRLMMGFLLLAPQPARLAMIGLGGGSLVKFCHRHLAGTHICVVEINPHVIALRDDFNLPPDGPRLTVLLGDGADFVRCPPGPVDVLLVDGFDQDGLPEALSSQRFYDDCAALLAPAGLLVLNLHAGHPQFCAQIERIRRSFAGATRGVDDSDGSNSVVFAGAAVALWRASPLRRPRGLVEMAWKSLQADFARIGSAVQAEIR